jgi:hypothetical protein
MPWEAWIFILIVIGYQLYKAYKAYAERQEVENLKHTNPQLYMHIKQMEHEQQMMAHDEKRMRHQNIQTGAGFFSEIFRLFWK